MNDLSPHPFLFVSEGFVVLHFFHKTLKPSLARSSDPGLRCCRYWRRTLRRGRAIGGRGWTTEESFSPARRSRYAGPSPNRDVVPSTTLLVLMFGSVQERNVIPSYCNCFFLHLFFHRSHHVLSLPVLLPFCLHVIKISDCLGDLGVLALNSCRVIPLLVVSLWIWVCGLQCGCIMLIYKF